MYHLLKAVHCQVLCDTYRLRRQRAEEPGRKVGHHPAGQLRFTSVPEVSTALGPESLFTVPRV